MSLKKTHVKQGDNVKVIAGAYKGVEGEITSVNVRKGRVTVKGVPPLKKAIRPTQEKPQGGFKDLERPIHISNVALVNGAKSGNKAESKKPAKKKVDKKK